MKNCHANGDFALALRMVFRKKTESKFVTSKICFCETSASKALSTFYFISLHSSGVFVIISEDEKWAVPNLVSCSEGCKKKKTVTWRD